MKQKKAMEISFLGWLILGIITALVILFIVKWINEGSISQINIFKDLI